MSNIIRFGEHDGKTLESLFFKNPSYVLMLHDNINPNIRQPDWFTTEHQRHFIRLFNRAYALGGTCSVCRKRPVTRMGLSTHHRSGRVGAVGFYCDVCEYLGGTPTTYYRPSFFVEGITLSPSDQKMIIKEIRRHFIGMDVKLTRKTMEEFFRNDANFANPEPGFFTRPVAAKTT